MHTDILLLGIIALEHVIQNNFWWVLMVLSDCLVYYLKIEKKIVESTKTILWF